MTKSGYVSCSDILLSVGGKAVGHCTSHTLDWNAETKERAVKPLASEAIKDGKWKEKGVTGLSISISVDALRFYSETENGYAELLKLFLASEPVEVQAYERGNSEKPYLVGNFVITKLSENNGAADDATYSVSLENSGAPTTADASVLTSGEKA
jgi:predicted secreted protein